MGDGIQDRLRRLRREGGEGAESSDSKASSRLKERLRGRLGRAAAGAPEPAAEAALCPTTEGEPVDLLRGSNDHGEYLARETEDALEEHHGDFALEEVRRVDPASFALLTADAALGELDPTTAVYLDTETTGLAGGAGTWVYMVGLGTFEGERFRVWQGFLSSPEGERALLAEVAERIASASAVISFFGKSFDRHRLEDKMRIVGVTPPFADRDHLDLYHPLRRLTLGRYPDGRLATLERELTGVERLDDLPGSCAPAAWLDYLAERPHRLEGVFRHNLDDVRSLVTLAAYLGRVEREERADGTPLRGCAATRARALARALSDAGRRHEALPWFERAIERGRVAELEVRDLELARAEALRRLGDAPGARAGFAALLEGGEDRHTCPAAIGLAKLLEHDLDDCEEALRVCERALESAERHPPKKRLVTDLVHRRERLRRSAGG